MLGDKRLQLTQAGKHSLLDALKFFDQRHRAHRRPPAAVDTDVSHSLLGWLPPQGSEHSAFEAFALSVAQKRAGSDGDMYVSPMSPAAEPSRSRQPHQLPPGRHGLERRFVASNQRERILAAVAEVVSLAGYAHATVEDIVVTAGVSRRTFYDNFRNKEDAFLASYDATTARLETALQQAFSEHSTFEGRVRACLATLLQFIAGEPALADMCIIEVMAAGPDAVERRNRSARAFTALIERAARESGLATQPTPLTAETVVGGVYEVVYSRLLEGRGDELPSLLADLTYTVLLPYIGQEAARDERRKLVRAAARSRRRDSG